MTPGSLLDRLAFQGTADDARTLLITVTSTVVTVIALVLGLTVVALQLSSTAFSPRLLRNFLRDRATQVVLSVFIATFVYSAAGLFTVGLSAGERTEEFPRLAISGSILLLFASLGMVVYFADHLMHSIQIDAINRRIERNTRKVIARLQHRDRRRPSPAGPGVGGAAAGPQVGLPADRAPRAAAAGGQRGRRDHLPARRRSASTSSPARRSAGSGRRRPTTRARTPSGSSAAVDADIRIGFERTIEQDVAFGIRQQIDIACKALSAAINDPYTAVQAIDHLTVVCCDIAVRPLGADVLVGPGGRGPGGRARQPVRGLHLLHRQHPRPLRRQRVPGDERAGAVAAQLLSRCCPAAPTGLSVLARAANRVLADAEREMRRPSDLEALRRRVTRLNGQIEQKLQAGH